MLTPEKNDVNILKLFDWGRDFTILDTAGNPLFSAYLRLAGDACVNRARVYALRKSRELRKQLKDLNSDYYLAYIDGVEELPREQLIESAAILKLREFAQDAAREIRIKMPQEPKSDASLEEQEQYQAEVDEFESKRTLILAGMIDKKAQEYKEFLSSKDDDFIRGEYITALINKLCEEELVTAFRDFCIAENAYHPDKTRMFDSIDQFLALPSEIKSQFISAYSSLEISMDELKKSRGVTP